MNEWKEVALGDLVHIKHGWAFKGEFFAENGELIVVTPGNFLEEGGFRVREGKEKFYTDDFPKEFLLKKDDLIIAMTEQGAGLLGSPALITEDNRFLHNQRIGLFQDFKKDQITKKYMYYLFFTQYIRGMIAGSSTGTKVKHTAPKRIYNIKVKLPSLLTQKKIAKILSNYDDLIENNLKRIKLLEESATLTYEEWFLRFRIDGEKLDIDSESGLPFGWIRLKLKECCDLTMGQSPKSEFYNQTKEGLPFHQGVTNYGFRFPTNANWSTKGIRVAKKGDILFSVRAPVGRLNVAIEQIILDRGLSSIRHKEDLNSFLFYQLQNIFFEDNLMGGGAIFDSVTKRDVENISIVYSAKFSRKFNDLAKRIDDEIENLTKQNQLLIKARDILLPRLMRGIIDVEELEIAV